MSELAEQFCPFIHEQQITAIAYDALSSLQITADASGEVAVFRGANQSPFQRFYHDGPVQALAIQQGGELFAVGDDTGTIVVYDQNIQVLFEESRPGSRGASRAFRGLAINPQGTLLAAVSIDNILRVWDLQKQRREMQWSNYSGGSVSFDARGERLLAITTDGQPSLIDIWRKEALYLDRIQFRCEHVGFSPDGTSIIAVGPAGFSVLEMRTGQRIGGQEAQRSSGILCMAISPDGQTLGTVTQNSVHSFSLVNFEHVDSYRHKTHPSGPTVWNSLGLAVAGIDGLLHYRDQNESVPQVTAIGAFGEMRAVIHQNIVASWRQDQRISLFSVPVHADLVRVNRLYNLLLLHCEGKTFGLYNLANQRLILPGDRDTDDDVLLGGMTVVSFHEDLGIKWWNIQRSSAYELPWPRGVAISNGGDMIAAITPKGRIRLLHTRDGAEAVPSPNIPPSAQVKKIAFVNKQPMLLALDTENVVSIFNLRTSIETGERANGEDLLQINSEVAEMWGISVDRKIYAVLQVYEEDSCMLIFIPKDLNEEPWTVENLHPYTTIDPASGLILEPVKSCAILERDMYGNEIKILRSMPDGGWISFTNSGVLYRNS